MAERRSVALVTGATCGIGEVTTAALVKAGLQAEVMSDGWLRTGDLARVDENRYCFMVDRKKDLIIRNDYNIYRREIEELLMAHPALTEPAVIGVPDDYHGEEVAAAVVLKPGAHVLKDALELDLRNGLALAKGPTDKITKRDIRIPGQSS